MKETVRGTGLNGAGKSLWDPEKLGQNWNSY
jgi:hypothetical protein